MMKTILAAGLAAILATAALAQTPPEPTPPPPPPPATETQKPPENPPAEQQQPATPPSTETPQQTPAPPPPPPPAPAPAPEAQVPAPTVLSDAASASYEQRRESLPAVNLYLPEGQASVRLRKLIKNVLFESQIDYEFVNGDISTFLRYKYYARNFTYRLGVFDSIDFPDITSDDSTREFERVRGGLLLVGIPRDYNNRWFFLLEDDSLSFGDVNRPDNRKNNIYTKIGFQYGTQFDERMNAIVGEQRGRITPVLTAFRDIGPQKTGLAAAITQAASAAGGDYTYTKFEAEALRRIDVSATSFVFSRLHVGAFVNREETNPPPVPRDRDGDGVLDDPKQWEFFDIPQAEFFRLGGREALKSIKSNDDSIGTYEAHLTNEYFFPIFRNKDYHVGALRWNTLYGIAYLGAGAVGFETSELAKGKRLVVDAGIGTENAITFRDWDIYLSVVYAKALRKPDEIDEGNGFRFSIRTVR